MSGRDVQPLSRNERIGVLCVALAFAALALLYFTPKTVLEWRIDRAIKCGASCLTEQKGVVSQVAREEVSGNWRVKSFKIRLQNSHVVPIHVDFSDFKVSKGQEVVVSFYGDEVVEFDGHYARQPWSVDSLAVFMFVPVAIVVALLQAMYLRFGVASWDKRSTNYTGWVSLLIAFLTGFALMKCHVWEVPVFVAGTILPLLGFAAFGLFYRLRSR